MPWGIGIGAGAGLLKYAMDKKTAEQQQLLQAKIAQWSPWTGMKANPVTPVNAVSDALPFAATGASMAQGMKLNDALTRRLDAGLNTGADNGQIVGSGVGRVAEASNMPSATTLGAGKFGSSPNSPTVSLTGSLDKDSAKFLSKQNPLWNPTWGDANQTLGSSWWNSGGTGQ